MKTDKVTKLLLALIALGVWLNIFATVVAQPDSSLDSWMIQLAPRVASIEANLDRLANKK